MKRISHLHFPFSSDQYTHSQLSTSVVIFFVFFKIIIQQWRGVKCVKKTGGISPKI